MPNRYDEFVDEEMVDSVCKIVDKCLNPVEIEKVYKHCEVRLYEAHDPRALHGDDVDELQEHEDFERADEYYGG